jgi:hypothetical protein
MNRKHAWLAPALVLTAQLLTGSCGPVPKPWTCPHGEFDSSHDYSIACPKGKATHVVAGAHFDGDLSDEERTQLCNLALEAGATGATVTSNDVEYQVAPYPERICRYWGMVTVTDTAHVADCACR